MAKKIEYPKLPPVFKAKWLAALRSGDYIKGNNYLQRTLDNKTTYCCLGVACKIQHPKLDIESHYFIEDEIAKNAKKVPKLLKGDRENSLIQKLAAMNDLEKHSFKQIANWIEKNL